MRFYSKNVPSGLYKIYFVYKIREYLTGDVVQQQPLQDQIKWIFSEITLHNTANGGWRITEYLRIPNAVLKGTMRH